MSVKYRKKELILEDKIKVIVRSNGGIEKNDGSLRKPNMCHKGYLRLHIGNKHYAVHRLVAIAFIPNPNKLPQVNHKDGNKTNNDVTNLEWVTNSENARHSLLHNLHHSKINTYSAKEIRQKYKTGKYTYETLAKEYGITFSMVGRIIRGTSWKGI